MTINIKNPFGTKHLSQFTKKINTFVPPDDSIENFLLLIRNYQNDYKLSNEYKVVDTQTSVLLCFFVELVYFLPVLSVSIKTDSGQVSVHVEIIR